MNESSLNDKQVAILRNLIKKSRVSDGKYICSVCCSTLNSKTAINYHIKNRHLLKELKNETMWISKKVKEGKRQINGVDGIIKFEWHCEMCENYVYPSHQGEYLKLFF